jgi:hypothetical protein
MVPTVALDGVKVVEFAPIIAVPVVLLLTEFSYHW